MRFPSIVIAAVIAAVTAACPSVVPPPQPTDVGEGEGEGDEGEGEEGEGEEGEGEGARGEGEGEEGEGEGEEGEGEEGEGEGVDFGAVAVEVMQATARPGQLVDEALKTLLDVVVFASNASNGGNGVNVRTFGTVTQNAAGTASYAAAPADALVLAAPGVTIRFAVVTFTGDFNVNDTREFYLRAHDVVASVVITGGDSDDFAFESHLAANERGTKSGAGVSGGDSFNVVATTVVSSDINGGAVDYRATDTRSGSVGDLDFTDSSAYHLVLVDNVVEDLVNTLTVSGTLGGASWSMTDGLVKRVFRNGVAVEPDFWGGTSGQLRKDGAAFGALAARDIGAGSFDIVLVTGNPADPDNIHVLETHPN